VRSSAKRRHQSPEWAILSQVDCFIQGEVKWCQFLLDSLHPRGARASWWCPAVLQGEAVKIFFASVSSGSHVRSRLDRRKLLLSVHCTKLWLMPRFLLSAFLKQKYEVRAYILSFIIFITSYYFITYCDSESLLCPYFCVQWSVYSLFWATKYFRWKHPRPALSVFQALLFCRIPCQRFTSWYFMVSSFKMEFLHFTVLPLVLIWNILTEVAVRWQQLTLVCVFYYAPALCYWHNAQTHWIFNVVVILVMFNFNCFFSLIELLTLFINKDKLIIQIWSAVCGRTGCSVQTVSYVLHLKWMISVVIYEYRVMNTETYCYICLMKILLI